MLAVKALNCNVPVAQLDRAQASDAWCRWFKSIRVRQLKKYGQRCPYFLILIILYTNYSATVLLMLLSLQLLDYCQQIFHFSAKYFFTYIAFSLFLLNISHYIYFIIEIHALIS